jgi:hypothetical protein
LARRLKKTAGLHNKRSKEIINRSFTGKLTRGEANGGTKDPHSAQGI